MAVNNENYRFKELADFLKTRRAKILPSQVGLPITSRRRTPGLRREEVAQLAGIGLTWYTWLEQGRSIRVSASVIESLCRVLLLDKNERRHLYLLANQPIPAEVPEYKPAVNPALQHVLDSLVLCPSIITDQRWNVLAWNKETSLVFGDYAEKTVRERNIVWTMFTENKYKQLFPDWSHYAKRLLGAFRASCGHYAEDSWLVQFIDDLKARSIEFQEWWSLHEIESCSEKFKKLNHPAMGIMEFEVNSYEVSDNKDLRMIVHVPLQGTQTAEKMKSLL